MFILICRYNRVFAYPGDDITLSSHLSPETSAVPMEVRWFRGTECIYLYKNGQVSIGKGYEGRASMFTPELKRGNVSLILKSVSPVDTGIYTCQVLTGHNKVEKSIHLYMSGMEPLSPDIIGPKLTDQDSVDLEESVVILELKKLLQQREKELQDKTKELETTSEMLRTKTSLLLYTDMDLENMSKLANQKEEHLKNMVSELKACKRQVETLGQKLQEKTVQVDELQAGVRDKKEKKHLGEIYEERHFTDELNSTAQYTADREEPVHSPELMVLLQNQEKELEEKSKQLESSTAALTRMTQMLQDRNTDVENLTKERDEYVKNVTGEIEMCLQELETLGLKLQEKNAEVEELRGFLNYKGLELEKGSGRQGGSGHVITVNHAVGASHEPFVAELLEKSEDVLGRIYHNPKEQLAEIESWIYAKREERRLREEKERTELLEKEFIDYVSAVKELMEKKTEKIVAWEQMMAVLENKLAVVETDEEREVLDMQLQEAVGMQKQGQEQIERLSKGIEEKRSGIEEKHKHMMEEINERYSAVARIEAETDILKIVLPDVQTYFRNVAADMKRSLDAWRHVMQTIRIPADAQTTDHTNVGIRVQKENRTDSSAEELEVVEMRSVKSSPEVNNNCFQTFIRKVDARPGVAGEPYDSKSEDTDSEDESNETLNSMMIIKRETKRNKSRNEYDETGEEDTE